MARRRMGIKRQAPRGRKLPTTLERARKLRSKGYAKGDAPPRATYSNRQAFKPDQYSNKARRTRQRLVSKVRR